MNKFAFILAVGITLMTFQVTHIFADEKDKEIPGLQNPFSVSFIKENLSKSKPRMIYTEQIVEDVRGRIKNIHPVK